MNILIACEFSGTVREEFSKLNKHNVVSCDLLDTSIKCDNYEPNTLSKFTNLNAHYKGHVCDVLYENWDMVISFPPCFIGGTLVLTKDGYKKIENITTQDYVLTHLGRWRRVTNIMSRFVDKTVKLKITGSLDITTTYEHPFYCINKKDKEAKNKHWVEANNLDKNKLVAFTLPPTEKVDISNDILWLMGRYVADGHIRIRRNKPEEMVISIGSAKLELFKQKSSPSRIDKCKTCYKAFYYKYDFCEQFLQFGRGAKNKKLPGWVLTLPKEQANIFLDGYLSGDGYFGTSTISSSSVSKELTVGISLLTKRCFNKTVCVSTNRRKQKTVIEGRLVNQNNSFIQYVTKSDKTKGIHLNEWRYNLFNKKEYSGAAYVYNLSVEEDESYTIESCIVHNCTHLACSGAKHFEQKRKDGRQQQGIDFFMLFANHPCEKIAIENPVGIMSSVWRKPDQIIQPYQFGDSFKKTTCLWLKGLPKLEPTNIVDQGKIVIHGGKKFPEWYSNAKHSERNSIRSKTFPGIAKAMASKWS